MNNEQEAVKRAWPGPTQLAHWLQAHGIDISRWGQGNAKEVADLWLELVQGDSVLETDPVRRQVTVVRVLIWQNGRLLLEIEQLLANGRSRRRHRPPSEKLKPGESYATAARRCLQEELGLADDQFHLHLDSHRRHQTAAISPSYPHLLTSYTFHDIEAESDHLPSAAFWRDNAAHAQGDPVQRHLWDWRPVDKVAL
ncbi:MAG: NUDIX domain-containing protein [Chloroflexota bacterium]|jgi:ADP-ribose pyrophosphatase YjhB (NUDIX family)